MDLNDEKEGEIEGDEILDKIGGIEYKEKLEQSIKNLEKHSNDFCFMFIIWKIKMVKLAKRNSK